MDPVEGIKDVVAWLGGGIERVGVHSSKGLIGGRGGRDIAVIMGNGYVVVVGDGDACLKEAGGVVGDGFQLEDHVAVVGTSEDGN